MTRFLRASLPAEVSSTKQNRITQWIPYHFAGALGDSLVKLKARLDAGPTAQDHVCTLRGRDIRRIAKEELGTEVSLSSVYRTLDAMGYSCLVPRPHHEKQDMAAQKKFKDESAPLL